MPGHAAGRPAASRFYAADLARGADGKWRVIDNHAETLAGTGFALANRIVHTHVAGDLFTRQPTRCGSRRTSSSCRIALAAHAPTRQRRDRAADARARSTRTISAHAYLARYLGFLLVEGGDLRTRRRAAST